MNLHNALILFASAIVAGIINAVAGGGSFVSFPSLLLTGVPPIQANATNTLALIPGAIASAAAYRNEYAKEPWQTIVPLVGTGVVGSLAGALVLLHTPQLTFLRLIPYLLGGATILFMVSSRITRWVRGRKGKGKGGKRTLWGWVWTLGLAICIAVYIGYFGAGAGILTLALLALIGIESIHTMNAYKALLVGLGNTIAMVAFVAAGMIYWAQAGIMLVGAMLGGYLGGYFSQKVDPKYTRYMVIVTGWSLTAYFFWKYGY